MPVSAFAQLRAELREAIRDSYDLLWTDAELDSIINEAQREYSLYSGALIGKVNVVSMTGDVFDAPYDFIEPLRFVDGDGYEIPFVSWRRLNEEYSDFRKVTGKQVLCACFDYDGYGKYRLFPSLPAGMNVGYLHYSRLAGADILEAKNMDAVKQHCLYQMFLLSGKEAMSNYWNNFIKSVNGEVRSTRTMRNRGDLREGRFY